MLAPTLQELGRSSLILAVAVIVALAIGWTILRFVLRLTMRLFMLGCLGILTLGAVLAALAFLAGQ